MAEVRAERLGLCAWLDELTASDWTTLSLCAGWSVHDVVAHLTTSTRTSLFDFVGGMVRYRGNFDRMEAERAKARADQFTPEELIAQIRAHADVPPTTVGSTPLDALIDVIVHSQDIARPLDRTRTTPTDRTVAALDHALASRWYGAKKRLGHCSLRATDTNWTGGTGDAEVHGPAIDLLLVATGRAAGLEGLSGAGVAQLAEMFV